MGNEINNSTKVIIIFAFSMLFSCATLLRTQEDSRNAEAYFNQGNDYIGKGQYYEAITEYGKAIEINPKSAKAYYNRAVVYFFKGEYNKSWMDAIKALPLGFQIPPEFLDDLHKASGGQIVKRLVFGS